MRHGCLHKGDASADPTLRGIGQPGDEGRFGSEARVTSQGLRQLPRAGGISPGECCPCGCDATGRQNDAQVAALAKPATRSINQNAPIAPAP